MAENDYIGAISNKELYSKNSVINNKVITEVVDKKDENGDSSNKILVYSLLALGGLGLCGVGIYFFSS